MTVSEKTWRLLQTHLEYSEEEMGLFRADPKNETILSKVQDIRSRTIVAEVVESHGCNSQHKVGDRFYFDGAGNLLTQYGPKKICAYALQTFATLIYGASEFIFAGLDPNDLTFKRIGCTDVGVRCGGWGHIAMEIKIEDRAVTDG